MFLSCHLYDGSYLVPADARELSDTVISFLLNNKTCFLQVKKELKLDRVSTVDNVKQSRESQTRQKFHLCFGLIRVVPLQKKVLAAIFLDSKPDFFTLNKFLMSAEKFLNNAETTSGEIRNGLKCS